MERISASIRLGAVVLGSALLGACASSYQQGSTSSPAVTTVNGPVTSSTGTAAYHQQVLQARDNKTAACLQTEVSSGKLLYHSQVLPATCSTYWVTIPSRKKIPSNKIYFFVPKKFSIFFSTKNNSTTKC